MTAKTKYIVIALLLIVLACTSVGLSTWNIHYQANVGKFNYDTSTQSSILDSYIYFGKFGTESTNDNSKIARESYPTGDLAAYDDENGENIFTYVYDGNPHSPTVFVPGNKEDKGAVKGGNYCPECGSVITEGTTCDTCKKTVETIQKYPTDLFLDGGALDVDWGITNVFSEIEFTYQYRLVSMPYASDHKGNSDNYCEITSINYNGTTATVYFTWKNGNGEHQGTNVPVALTNNNGSYSADENHGKIGVTFDGTNAIITVKGFTPFTIDMTTVANAGYTTTAPTDAGVYECRITAESTSDDAVVKKAVELLNANPVKQEHSHTDTDNDGKCNECNETVYATQVKYAIKPHSTTMTQGETTYEKDSQQKQSAKRTTLGTAPLSDTTNTGEVSEEGTVTIEIGESQETVSYFTYKGATYQISFSATINNGQNTPVLFTLDLENDAHNISDSNKIDSSYVYSTYGFSSDPNYQISNPVVYYSILKREIKLNAWTANTFEYNGQKQYPTVSSPASDSASMYDATLEYFWIDNDTVSTTAPINANTNGGNYTVWVALDEAHRGNYFLTVGDATVGMIDTYVNDATTPRIGYNYTITPKEIGVDWDESTLSFTYDGTEHVPTATATGLVSQNGVLDTCNITVKGGQVNANAYTNTTNYTATADSLDNTNYKLADTKPTTTFVINQKQVGVTWGTTSFTYNGSKQKSTATVNPGDLCGADECTVTVTGEQVNAGTNYTATASSLSNLNYKLADTKPTTTFTINPKTIGISWSNTMFTYDGTSHKPTATATGLESQNGVLDTCTITVEGQQTNAGTNYTATASSLSNANYQLPSDKTQEFTINKRTIIIAWSNLSFTYDGTNKIPTAIVSNLVTGDDCTITVTGEQTNAGTHTATASSISGTSSGNYQLPTANTTSFTIAKANYDMSGVSFTDGSFTYDGSAHSLTIVGTLPTGKDGIQVTVSYSGSATNVSESAATVIATFATTSQNYNTPTQMTAKVTITKADYDMSGVSFANATFTYDGNKHAPSITGELPTGKDGIKLGVTITGGATNVLDGTQTATATFTTTSGNYNTPAQITATVTITKADYDMSTVSFADTSKEYNGKPQYMEITGTLPTGKDGIQVTVNQYTGTATNVADGAVDVTVTFATTSTNYNTPSAMTAKFNITAKDIAGAKVLLGGSLTYNGNEQIQTVATVTTTDSMNVDTFTISNNTGTNAGKYTLTITGTGNFTGTTTKDWTIAKATQSVPTDVTTTDNADGTGGTITANTDVTMQYTSTPDDESSWKDFTGTATVTENGTYYVRYAETTNYHASEHITVAIGKKLANITIDSEYKTEYVYGETISDPTYTYVGDANESDITITWYKDSVAEGNEAEPINAGTYIVVIYAPAPDTATCTDARKELVVTISKISIEKPAEITTSFVYTGVEQTYNLTENTTAYTITNNKRTNAGSQTVTVALNDKTNYQWTDSTIVDLTYTFAISKGTAVITVDTTDIVVEYGDPWTLPEATAPFGATIKCDKPTNMTAVGNYSVTFTVNGTDNYDGDTKKINITVNPKSLAVPTISESFTYTGSSLQADIFKKIQNYYPDTMSYSHGELTNAGNKIITFALKNTTNYCWSDKTTTNKEVVVTINKATPTVTVVYTGKYYEHNVPSPANGLPATYNGKTVKGTYTLTGSMLAYGYSSGQTADGNGYTTFTDTTDYSITSTYSNITFTPTDTVNYNTVTIASVSITFLPVAFNGSTYYGTIVKGLSDAVSGETVEVIVGANPIVKENCEIKSGVILTIPYAQGQANSSTASSTDQGVVSSFTSIVTIDEKVTLTNNGTLEIGGILSGSNGGANWAGQTAESASKIVMKANSTINSTGTINSYGYISEESTNNGSQIISNGTLNLPFILRDFRGGSIMYALYNAIEDFKSSAFNQFQFINVEPKLTVNYGGFVNGWANLYAGGKHNATTVKLIGNTSDYLIQFTDSTYSSLTAKYNPTSEINDLDLYGGATINSMELTVNAGITTVNVSTSTVYFPLTWRFDISTNPAVGQNSTAQFTMNQLVKMMTGSKVTISKGSKLTVKELIVYSSFTDTFPTGTKYASQPAAELTVNGELSATTLAGQVKTTEDNAKLTVSTGTSVISYEPSTHSGSSLTASIDTWTIIVENLNAYLFEGTKLSNKSKNLTIGTYYSKSGGWYSDNVTIYYDGNGTTLDNTITSQGPYGIDNSGYKITSLSASDPTRDYYTFTGWYIDKECTTLAIGQTIYCNTYVYAGWKVNEYTINYVDKFYNDFSTTASTNNTQNLSKFTYETNTFIYDPSNGDSDGYYVFGGWYIDEACTTKVTEYNGKSLVNNLVNDQITLYALWYPAGTKSYTVNYSNSNNELHSSVLYRATDSIISTNTKPLSTFALLDMSAGNTDREYTKYFDGWYTAETGGTKVTQFSEDLFTNGICTLYARWIDKYTVKLAYTIEGFEYSLTYYYYNDSLTLPTIDELIAPTSDANGNIILKSMSWSATASGSTTTHSCGEEYLVEANTILTPVITDTIYYMFTLALTQTTAKVTISNGDFIEASALNTASSNDVTKYTTNATAFGNLNNTSEMTTTIYVKAGANVSVALTYKGNAGWFKGNGYKLNGGSAQQANGASQTATINNISSTNTIQAAYNTDGTCVAAGTLILMADGTQKKVEDIIAGDMVLVFNHETGTYDVSEVLFNTHNELEWQYYDILNLVFSNGTTLQVINEHVFFDIDLNKYVVITYDNVQEYVGHRFYSATFDGTTYSDEIITLSQHYMTTEYTGVYSPITAYHTNCFTNGLLTIAGEIHGLYNIFELGDNMTYDMELMAQDIEKYGLYTYADFEKYVDYDVFVKFNAKYFKVAVEKGMITFDKIVEFIDKYLYTYGLTKEGYVPSYLIE